MKFSLYWKHNLIVSCTNRDTSNQDFSILTLTTKLIYGRAVGKVWSKGYANKKLLDPKFRPFLREVVIPKHYNLGHSKDLGDIKVFFFRNCDIFQILKTIIYRKVASTNTSRLVARLVFKHTKNLDFLIRNTSWI